MATINNTADNLSFHSDYRDSLQLGIRVPLDDRGLATLHDRPFALGNHIVGWKEGSVNLAVKKLMDVRGETAEAGDVADLNAGKLDIRRLNKYIDKDMLYGYQGDSRNKIPNDLMSFRGYPTYEIIGITYETIELNQDTVLTENTGNETITCTSDNIFNQVKRVNGTVFPITLGNDYVIISGYVDLKESVPFDSIHILIKQKISIQNVINLTFNDMWGGTYTSPTWAVKTECHNDGSNTRFWFRLEAECSDAVLDDGIDFSDKALIVKIEDDVFTSPYGDDFWYGNPIIATTGNQLVGVTYVGGKWVGSGNVFAVDVEAPTIPLNLSVSSNVETDLTLIWDASTDNIGIREYEVSVTKFGVETIYTTPNNSPTIDLTVEGGAEYTFKVRAFDYAYNVSAWSTPLIYTTASLTLEIAYSSIFYDETSSGACGLDSTVARYVYSRLELLNGTYTGKVYNNIDGSVAFNGQNKWWRLAKTTATTVGYAIKIDTNGYVIGYVPC